MNEQFYRLLQEYLLQTLNPSTQKEGSALNLSQAEGQQGFPILLLRTVSDESVDQTIRMAAAVYFKNYVKRNWVRDNEQDADKITQQDRAEIKNQIVQLMITVPEKLQLQISDALSLIADADFPANWETLLPELISKLSPTDYRVNNGILSTAHSIFKKWRSQFRSDDLFIVIKYVLDLFCEPYKQLFEITDKLIQENNNNAQALNVLARSLNLLIKIYYDLNCQDLPEFFEDRLQEFSNYLQKYLVYHNPLLATDDEEEEGPLEQIKTSICDVLELYASHYSSDFPQLESFVPIVINLLTSATGEAKYDALVCKAFSVLSVVVRLDNSGTLFADENSLKATIERIALPNVALRTADEELYEDNPIEYIRRDLEGSDSDTRRRAAADFIRNLLERYEQNVTKVMSEYINQYLQKYNTNPQANWKDKNTAIFLLVAIASRSITSSLGVTKVNSLVDIVDFFSKNVLCDLQSDVNTAIPILKVDAIKYVYTFRNQLTKEQLLTVFPLLVKHLESTDYVVYTYAAIAIERILFIRQGKTMMFTAADIKPYAETLLTQLFRLIEQGQTPEKLSENDYLMRAVMRVIITSRQDMVPYVNVIMSKLTGILAVVMKNPSNPKFNHYVFESIGALIRFICPISNAALSEFESMCFGPFENILSQDVAEFTPYVFQLLAQLLEQHKGTELTQSYIALLNPLLNPSLWEQGNTPALVRLTQAYLEKGVTTIIQSNQLEPILGIFQQKLVYSRQFDHYGMLLLLTITCCVPLDILSKYFPALLSAVLKRLQSKKRGDTIIFDRFTRNFTLWMTNCFLTESLGGPDTIINVYEALQPGLFGQIMNLFVLPDISRLSKPLDRKIGAAGMVHLLTKSALLLQEPYLSNGLWKQSLLGLLALLELPVSADDDEGPDELYTLDFSEDGAEGIGYQTTFAKLTTTSPTQRDPTAQLPPAQIYIAQQLMAMPADKRQVIKTLIAQSQEATSILPKYFASANISMDQL
ncbi:Cse1-domain-containing protein [Mycotypha africana]|uniref:Cse1-domain-containing protein n=1 Tax=Mycotypha africana TaxID=64632 RepID=UPI0023005011|nr:Cse1-domain-containing protein [Mycotypha africana]KAI8977279.1 Cse1-domain-containing protein [Mycotypha africana]